MMQPGDIVKVVVEGVEYDTIIDIKGVKRNDVVNHLYGQGYDLNQLAIAYHNGRFRQRDWAEFNMMLGYSVSGFRDLPDFEDWTIENPL